MKEIFINHAYPNRRWELSAQCCPSEARLSLYVGNQELWYYCGSAYDVVEERTVYVNHKEQWVSTGDKKISIDWTRGILKEELSEDNEVCYLQCLPQ